MNILDDSVELAHCARHPNRGTALRCGKCDTPICPRCVVQTPVGARCRECAQLRRLPQFDIPPLLLARSVLAGFAVSSLGWFFLSYIVFLRFFLGILVGAAIGETMSRLARRRDTVTLEAGAVAAVIAGLLLVETFRYPDFWTAFTQNQSVSISLAIPAVIASFVAVVKLR
jgi:hypothetical protein